MNTNKENLPYTLQKWVAWLTIIGSAAAIILGVVAVLMPLLISVGSGVK